MMVKWVIYFYIIKSSFVSYNVTFFFCRKTCTLWIFWQDNGDIHWIPFFGGEFWSGKKSHYLVTDCETAWLPKVDQETTLQVGSRTLVTQTLVTGTLLTWTLVTGQNCETLFVTGASCDTGPMWHPFVLVIQLSFSLFFRLILLLFTL